ncbi:hypothetical protein PENTCL1PPCAC_11250, partial [Pristionchus entomophagus]
RYPQTTNMSEEASIPTSFDGNQKEILDGTETNEVSGLIEETEQLLNSMQSPHGSDEREIAKKKCEEFANDTKPYQLFNIYKSPTFSIDLRSLALDNLFKLFWSYDGWKACRSTWEKEKIDEFCHDVIQSFPIEMDDMRKEKLARMIGMNVARGKYWADKAKWEELEKYMKDWSISENEVEQKNALMIAAFSPMEVWNKSEVRFVMEKWLITPSSSLRKTALYALHNFINRDEWALESLPRLLPILSKIMDEGWTGDEQCLAIGCIYSLNWLDHSIHIESNINFLFSFFKRFDNMAIVPLGEMYKEIKCNGNIWGCNVASHYYNV